MIVASYIFLVLFTSIMFEVMVGSLGVILPLAAMAVFYFSMVYGWRIGICLGFFSGLAIDMLYCREMPVSALSFMAVSGVTIFWLLKGETKDFFLHAIPGVLVSAVTVLPVVFIYWRGILLGGIWDLVFIILFSLISGAVFLPFMVFFLDLLSELLGMELYRKARENIEERI
ncbi:MAG TPA: hypothetical protein DCZ94_09095 [Lentisphaeria bacterium]|nr:MAG: hypothetical protein A2X48_18545 [Lentisphaerae bacterium GWF2_49_21]HBC87096.1 hypothetical protein [Lentisphaeria bacterium]